MAAADRRPFRRRATTLAVLLMLAGTAEAFDIPTGNPDLALRWDNTFRYNLGFRTQSQDPNILASPNFDDGDRNFSNGSLVTNRLDLLSEFDLIYKRKYGLPRQRRRLVRLSRTATSTTPTTPQRTRSRWTPGRGHTEPVHETLRQGSFGRIPRRVRVHQLRRRPTCRSTSRPASTPSIWGDSLLLGGAIHGISYAQNSVDVWKGFATPGSEAKELFRPRGGLTLQAQPTHELSLAGQWFYNWQADRISRVGQLPDDQRRRLNFGGDSLIFGPNPLAAAIPGAPAFLRLWNTNRIQQAARQAAASATSVCRRAGVPQWLDGTLGFYYRNTTDVFAAG